MTDSINVLILPDLVSEAPNQRKPVCSEEIKIFEHIFMMLQHVECGIILVEPEQEIAHVGCSKYTIKV